MNDHHSLHVYVLNNQESQTFEEEILQDVYNHINYIYDAVPEEYTYTMYDYDLAFIAEDDSVAYLKLAADKLKALLAFIENKENK